MTETIDRMLCHTISTPIKLRHCTLKNRIVFGAHTANMSEGGLPLDPHFGYCRGRARGGSFRGATDKKASEATATSSNDNVQRCFRAMYHQQNT